MSQSLQEWSEDNQARRRVLEFLTLDIQNSPQWIEDLLDKITALETQTLPAWQRTGNAFHLSLSPEQAAIEDLGDEESETQSLPLNEFKQAVILWQQQIQSDP
ncbi:MAG: hypothetical protein LRZ84_01110 [Desertifilum sp.]|nr:hypothetical protein [Desertifilum sp.]MDI9639056.1 hypothetical protein [Geitlerinema splendidum]